ncbi:preprotein translocase subunit SecY [Candidatus Woesearchaeota archaeon]|nr:preprotein translocase subunit SecY [Candidatus Woesearchaeota archaeon]
MSFYDKLIQNLPEVVGPTQKRLGFKEKLKWTLIILVIFFVLGLVPLFGMGQSQLDNFENLSLILGASFGSIISLGIGPLVTASIVLQLLNGAGIVKFDLTSSEGKIRFQGTQKLMSLFFIIFEAIIYVFMGGLPPPVEFVGTPFYFPLQLIIVFQLILGGILILFMDETVSKWGIGKSGISLFIAAGVSLQLFTRIISPLPSPTNPEIPVGALPWLFKALSINDDLGALLALAAIIATVIVFVMAVYSQAMKVEIPLSFGRVRGYGIRWPLKFIYTSNIPVILVAALLANVQLWARLLQNWGHPFLGTFNGNIPASGFVQWVYPPNLVEKAFTGTLNFLDIGHGAVYMLFMLAGCVLFSYFWVQTSGMDAKSQAKQIMASGLQVPGFRKDPRVMERLLDRYIGPLTILGGLAIGILAGMADLLGALANGTSILLAVMIIYQFYEEIAKEHLMDLNPAMRKFME